MHLLIAGCGWLGQAVAAPFLARGDRVTAVVRRGLNRAVLEGAGMTVRLLDLSDPRSAEAIPTDLDAIVACQAPTDRTAEAYRRTYVEITSHLLEACRSRPVRSFVYTGSTRVFGQKDGSDVDETTPPSPEDAHARILHEVERLVLDASAGGNVPGRVVRISGLYGPGRVRILERVRRGALALGPDDDRWMNFCHRDDAVGTILAALDHGRAGGVYHATDAEPARASEVNEWVASRLGIEPTRSTAASGEEDRRDANRRVLGERTREELGVKLAYPSFREGLAPFLPK